MDGEFQKKKKEPMRLILEKQNQNQITGSFGTQSQI